MASFLSVTVEREREEVGCQAKSVSGSSRTPEKVGYKKFSDDKPSLTIVSTLLGFFFSHRGRNKIYLCSCLVSNVLPLSFMKW